MLQFDFYAKSIQQRSLNISVVKSCHLENRAIDSIVFAESPNESPTSSLRILRTCTVFLNLLAQ